MILLEAGLNPEQQGDPWILCHEVGRQRPWVYSSQEGGEKRGMGEGETEKFRARVTEKPPRPPRKVILGEL